MRERTGALVVDDEVKQLATGRLEPMLRASAHKARIRRRRVGQSDQQSAQRLDSRRVGAALEVAPAVIDDTQQARDRLGSLGVAPAITRRPPGEEFPRSAER